MKNMREIMAMLLKIGTWQATLFFVAIGLVVAILLLTIGFWKTMLILACCLLGAFIGGVKDKKGFIRRILSSLGRDRSI